ncbi:N-lysine methyltransferase SMYD2-A [Phytophthora nicotianae]|uniref:N-lysine methyltransferase SMYD2-A n=1 Tax=Phytophthora nicotianae TaxID=4792 RepID=A0A0W8CT19_PHYNI|nr:N-lysine methyltransferase SMYD2-A [Phytophthora nicotianae]
MQTAPSPSVIDNLPETPDQAAISLSPDVPLLELDHPADTTGLGVPSTTGVATTPTVYSHVNRVLDRITVAAGVDAPLTSHSFRHGGAQHANGSGELTARWIFDRGAWNMSTTNKGFNYIFNTSKEDHKEARHNVNQAVLDVLTSTVIRHYPLLKNLNAEAPAVKRIDACVAEAGCSLAELLAWSSHLASPEPVCEELKPQCTTQPPSQALARSAEQKIIDHQTTVINHFIEHVKLQDSRMDALEAKLNDPTQVARKRHKQESSTSDVSQARKKNAEEQLLTFMRLGTRGTLMNHSFGGTNLEAAEV